VIDGEGAPPHGSFMAASSYFSFLIWRSFPRGRLPHMANPLSRQYNLTFIHHSTPMQVHSRIDDLQLVIQHTIP
jgi:hypothetical protein